MSSLRQIGFPLSVTLLVVTVFLVYWSGLNGGFVFDDMPNIVENRALHVTSREWADWIAAAFSSPSSTFRRPLASLTFAANHYFAGLDARTMKLTNIFIHALNSLLVFGLARELVRCVKGQSDSAERVDTIALFVASFWALNPINVMAVLYVVQRMESLSHLFVFGALWAYVCLRRRLNAGVRQVLVAGAVLVAGSIAGAMAKESAVLTTLYAWCLEVTVLRSTWPAGQSRRILNVLYAVILWIPATVAVAYLLPGALAANAYAGRSFTLVERLLTEARVLVDYLHWMILPDLRAMGLYHDDYVVSEGLLSPNSTLVAFGVLATLLGIAAYMRRRRPLLSLGIFWFFAAHVLTAGFIPLELVFEHRNYFASLGVAVAAGDLLLLMPREGARRVLAGVLAMTLVALLAGATSLRALEWQDPLRFAESEASKHPNSPRATYERARVLVILSGYDRSSPFDRPAMAAIEAARRVPGTNVLPVQAALIFAARTGRDLKAEWWIDLETKLQDRSEQLAAVASLRALVDCSNQGQCNFPSERMLSAFAAAMRQGESAEVLNVYGNFALNSLADPALALRAWEAAAAASPDEPQYHANLARLLLALGRPDEAEKHVRALQELGGLGQYDSLIRSIRASNAAGDEPVP